MTNLAKYAIAAALTAASLTAEHATAAEMEATYNVNFNGTWSTRTHPKEYPAGAHFSGLIGATHGAGYVLFKSGAKATPGLKKLSETGKHSPLNAEIRAAIAAGKAGSLIASGPVFNLPRNVTTKFKVTRAFPMVSLVAMIAPSPDWFAGVSSVALMRNGVWVKSRTITVYAWDAGTDDGTTYKAANKASTPHRAIALNKAPHFMMRGKRVAVGTITFTRVDQPVTN